MAVVEIGAVSRSYGDVKAVDNVSFKIKKGEIVGLLGHNGAGKTTIMKMLTGFLEQDSGEILIDGLNILQDRVAVQEKIGYLPENCPLYLDMTVIDYLQYSAGLHGIESSHALHAAHDAIMRTELAEKSLQLISTLSRGYRQRVGVAQAILHQPQILILDEPTNGLDPSQIQHMRQLIIDFAKDATVILSTHILQEVQAICDRVIIIRNGEKIVDSPLDELQQASRLLVTVDATPKQTDKILSGLKSVRKIDYLYDDEGRHHYALQLVDASTDEEIMSAAPEVANVLLANKCKLYALHPEISDLETVFANINAPEEKASHA